MLDLNPIMQKTTAKLFNHFNLPKRYNGVYLPVLPFIPFILLWVIFGIMIILVFGGFAILIGKEDKLFHWWFR